MNLVRILSSLVIATVVVLVMLTVGLHFFETRREPAAQRLQSFQIEYLTPEEAAELLGEKPTRFRAPDVVTLPPSVSTETDTGDDRS